MRAAAAAATAADAVLRVLTPLPVRRRAQESEVTPAGANILDGRFAAFGARSVQPAAALPSAEAVRSRRRCGPKLILLPCCRRAAVVSLPRSLLLQATSWTTWTC